MELAVYSGRKRMESTMAGVIHEEHGVELNGLRWHS